jgi:hypothetical protein
MELMELLRKADGADVDFRLFTCFRGWSSAG